MIPTQFHKKDLKLMRETFASLYGRVLDIGCGDMLDRVGFSPGDEYIGVDITKSKYTIALADVHKLPFKNESFDACICNFVLEHVREPEIALIECNRILKMGGMLWVSVPFLQHIHAYHDFRRYTDQGLAYEVEKAGFRIDRLHGSYGVADTIEYLLFSALLWKVNDALMASHGLRYYLQREQKKRVEVWKAIKGLMKKEGVLGIIYIFLIAMFFIIFKSLGVLFNSQQKKDVHHAISFKIIAYKE